MRAWCLCRILIRMQRVYFTGRDTGNAMNSHRKIIPGTYTLIAEMVNTRNNSLINSCIDSQCQVICIGRCANLIENHPQRLTLTPQPYHRFHKIVSIDRIQPGGTDHHCFLAILHHFFLPTQLSKTVNRIRTRRTIFFIRYMRCSIKDIIRRNLYHSSTIGLCSTCQYARSFLIQFAAQLFVIFRFINCRIGSTVHNHFNAILCNTFLHCLLVADVQFLYIRKKIRVLWILFCKDLHFVTKLSVGPGY